MPEKKITLTFGKNQIRIIPGRRAGSLLLASNLKMDGDEHIVYNYAIDGLEALVLAQASSGINVRGKKYLEALETALEAISNNT